MLSTAYSNGKLRAYSSGVFPKDVSTIRDYVARWRPFLERVHEQGIKVQAVCSMTFLWGNQEETTGFFKYYNDLWEGDLLGPKPHPRADELIEQDGSGTFATAPAGELAQYKGCVNNPHWQALLKGQVRLAIETGFDGLMVWFPYKYGPCAGPFCQQQFREFLAAKYSRQVLMRKFAIPDRILLKPGRLTAEEFEIMKTHSLIGADTIRSVRARAPRAGFMEMAEQIARHHHEWFDGNGYPDGLSGNDIPLAARVVAVADVYDALTTRRVYKDAVSHEAATDVILGLNGRQFDPRVIEAFQANLELFAQHARELNDESVAAASDVGPPAPGVRDRPPPAREFLAES